MLILASGSPRRAKILEGLGVAFEVVKTDAPEVSYPHDPERTVRENALLKGAAASATGHVLSADTIVWYDGRIYGKPRDLEEARAFLRELSGRVHTVFTGVAYDGEVKVVKSEVKFRELDERKIAEYVERVHPTDRAGAYDIDESGDLIVEGWTGSYENIMGLPVEPLIEWGIGGGQGLTALPRRGSGGGQGLTALPRRGSGGGQGLTALPRESASASGRGMRSACPQKEGEGGVKGVVFDFGGVMTSCTMPERVRPLVRELGVSWEALEEGFRKYRRLMDANLMPFDEMYRRIWADAGVTIDEPTQAKILEEDMASFLYPNLRTLDWMRRLKGQGYRIGILTNMCTLLAEQFRRTFGDFISLADAMVISGEERLYKPQREIYDLLRERIGLDAGELVFVDDVEGNCEGARAAGWKALRFETNDQVERDFARMEGAADLAPLIDHTYLKEAGNRAAVEKLCAEARAYRFASVCVYPADVAQARAALAGSGVKVCSVIDFPKGTDEPQAVRAEALAAIEAGADELDTVLNRARLRTDAAALLADEQALVRVCKAKRAGLVMKLILECCDLTKDEIVAGCALAKEAGYDFVKTSTGFSAGGATVEDVALMRRTVGPAMGVKAAGGIRTRATALAMVEAGATRIGASAGLALLGQ